MPSMKKDSKTPKTLYGKPKIGSVYEKWPKIDGNPEDPVFLTHCTSTNLEDEILVGMLESYGIPAVMKYPYDGTFGKVVMGISGNGVDIYVPASLLNDAKALTGGNYNE